MTSPGFDLRTGVDVLTRTPATLRVLLAGQPDALLRANEGLETFSAFDVVGNLIDGEETDWIPRARIIRAGGDDPRFPPFDRFRPRARNSGRSLPSLLDEFERQRAASLAELTDWRLTAADLELPGIHPALGRATLGQLLATWVVHDLGHLAQIARVMAKHFAADVGPWRAYLPVLADRTPPPR